MSRKPKLKTELIRVDYWSCGTPGHRHKTAAVASSCIEKMEKRAALCSGTRKWTAEVCAAVLKQHREGARKCDIARSLGISNELVRQVLAKAERFEQAGESSNPFDRLSVRSRNCLREQNLNTVEAVRAALADGRLDDVPRLGAVSKTEVRAWLDTCLTMPHSVEA